MSDDTTPEGAAVDATGQSEDERDILTTTGAEARRTSFGPGGAAGMPAEKTANFGPTVKRLSEILGAEKVRLGIIAFLTLFSVSIVVIGPRLLGQATDIIVDGLLYLLSDRGLLTCVDLETGEEVWNERVGGNYLASPLYVDGKIYLCSNQGKFTLFKPGRTYQHIAENNLDEGLMASPVPYGNALILRTKTQLYRIEE